jgi:uncharacterized damage-inducible protein DinB
MDYAYMFLQLSQNSRRIEALVREIPLEQARWKPAPESWSILEVVNHLLDEERQDFRVRLDIILHHPDKKPPPIDPQGWVTARAYNQRELAESLQGYLDERQKSLEWLRTLDDPDWEKEYAAPFGSIKAGDMFAAWVTHDQLHMRQLVEIQRAYLELQAKPYRLDYAGEW